MRLAASRRTSDWVWSSGLRWSLPRGNTRTLSQEALVNGSLLLFLWPHLTACVQCVFSFVPQYSKVSFDTGVQTKPLPNWTSRTNHWRVSLNCGWFLLLWLLTLSLSAMEELRTALELQWIQGLLFSSHHNTYVLLSVPTDASVWGPLNTWRCNWKCFSGQLRKAPGENGETPTL